MRRKAAECLLKTEAVFFRPDDPFTWASGIKSPIYCDNRLVLSDPQSRETIEEGLIALIRSEYPEAEALFGTATAGIAHAAIAAHEMGLPMGYVRSSAKDHGRGSRIEGRVLPGQKVVVVEDLISTGGSVISAAKALEEAGAEVLGVVCIFSYNLNKSREAFAEANLEYKSLTDFDAACEAAAETGYIQSADIDRLMEFRNSL